MTSDVTMVANILDHNNKTYLYACWLRFSFAFFKMKDLTDFYDFWHP